MATWRDHCRPIIADVIADYVREFGSLDIREVRRRLRAAYPYGERKWHPYKIWCDEIKRQLGLKPKVDPIGRAEIEAERLRLDEQTGQLHLFEIAENSIDS